MGEPPTVPPNLIKMKILHKFNYLFWNCPQWIPKSFLSHLNRLFSSFLWGPRQPRYKLTTLMHPTSQGGLAFPDCQKHFLPTQLVTVAWWLVPDLSNSALIVKTAVVSFVEALSSLAFRGSKAPYDITPSMLMTLRAWRAGLVCECYPKTVASLNAPYGITLTYHICF